jgi:acetolactate synthase-1/2/3 large subunit
MANTVRIGSKKTGAWLVRHALEQLPVSFTFGIPGVHTTELYDELNRSERIRPILVTHEGGAAFMADAVSRTSPRGEIGVLAIVPAAGLTHALSGIGEAFLAGVPLLIVSGGIRTDIPFGYQLHEIDPSGILSAVTKRSWKVKRQDEIVPAIFEAYHTAVTGVPGPVFVEIPVNVQLFKGDINEVPSFEKPAPEQLPPLALVEEAVELLCNARRPGMFVGWGAVDAVEQTMQIAEMLGAPVSTTLQGLSAFPGHHPLHTGMGFSRAAVPAAENAFKDIDCLLAAGTRFGEIPTGSFGAQVPEKLIHVDIDPDVIGRNYKTRVGIRGDARAVLSMIAEGLKARGVENLRRRSAVEAAVASDKQAYRQEWRTHTSDRVNPALFFDELREQLADDAILALDDGHHTFLAAELWESRRPRTVISPTDFNCMGYCVPAAIGAAIANPGRQVVGVVGDGAFLMTAMEILTASVENAGVAFFVFHDGELSQISQGQEIPYNRKTCTILGNIRLEGIALATGAEYAAIQDNDRIRDGIRSALATAAGGQPVIIDVRIDYSKRTRFTRGVVQTVLKRFPLGDRFRFIGRALLRKVTG